MVLRLVVLHIYKIGDFKDEKGYPFLDRGQHGAVVHCP